MFTACLRIALSPSCWGMKLVCTLGTKSVDVGRDNNSAKDKSQFTGKQNNTNYH